MIISFDAVRDALELCLEGKISICVECNPLHGPRVASLIRQLEAGETPAKLTYVDETFFSPGVLSEELIRGREYWECGGRLSCAAVHPLARSRRVHVRLSADRALFSLIRFRSASAAALPGWCFSWVREVMDTGLRRQ